MSRHPLDHQAPSDGGRVKHFAKVERDQGAEGSHPASKTLSQRPAERDGRNRRAEEFTRIEREARD